MYVLHSLTAGSLLISLPQSGKSSLVNSLVRNAAVPVYQLASTQDGHSTTTYPQEIALEISGKKIRLVDTPGLSLINAAESEADVASHRARDILTRSKGRIDRLKDPQPVGKYTFTFSLICRTVLTCVRQCKSL